MILKKCTEIAPDYALAWGNLANMYRQKEGYENLDKSIYCFKKATKLSSIDLTLTGRNLALWTDVVGVDPEINQSGVANGFGIDYFTNPTTSSFVFSVKINY